jgi:exopolysaccharide biosynthesis polyprenyl glycosylphosphotransferase
MLGSQRLFRTRIQKVVDAGLFALGFYLAWLLRANAPAFGESFVLFFQFFGGRADIQPFHDYTWYALFTLPAAMVLLEIQGFYKRPLIPTRWQTIVPLFKVCLSLTLGIVVVLFLTKAPLSRGVIVLFGVISFVLVMLREELMRHWLRAGLRQGLFERRLLLVGMPEETARLRAEIAAGSRDGLRVVAELDVHQHSLRELVERMHEDSINAVVLAARHTYFGQLEKVIQACELEGVEAWLMADFFKTEISQASVDELNGRPMMVFRSAPEASWQAAGKALLDFGGSVALLLLAAPLMLACAALVRLTSAGPVFFRQQRSGLNGQPFTMLKFRTMVTDAEQRKHELAAFNEMSGPVFKVTNDPRVTPVGRFLRKWSLDELPQLFNVLRGEMSLVGPRPLPVDETRRFEDYAHRRRLSVKPGLTCLWQISGRNEVKDFNDWVRLDLEYIDNWSFWLDLWILMRTVPVVLLGTGAR